MSTSRHIQKLSEATINKIAAGEVIERPASIVKELLENAIDSGADKIVLELKASGKEYIKISDNGCGIPREDAELVFERYATSKISTIDDIYSLNSMGFRGEALSSIAAVADVEILTNTEEGRPAVYLEKKPAQPLALREASRARGTSITVRNIFHNVPVRRKFLSSDASELARITAVFSNIAVGHPGIAFRLIADGTEKINLASVSDPVMRISHVFGSTLGESMISSGYSDETLDIKVHFTNLDYTRSNRTGQLFFVNRRLIESKAMERGIRVGYKDLLPPGRFPVVFAFLTINPEEIDVNVHPAKKEIRFSDDEMVLRAVSRSILAGFKEKSVYRTYPPPLPAGPSAPAQNGPAEASVPIELFPGTAPQVPDRFPPDIERALASHDNAFPLHGFPDLPSPAADLSQSGITGEVRQLLVQYFQLHNTYLFCQIKNGLLIIDQHVAPERVIYERAQKNMGENDRPPVQQLLFPVMLDLGLPQKMKVEEYSQYFIKLGFSLRLLSGNSIVVDGVPATLKDYPVKTMMLEIIETMAKESPEKNEMDRHFARSYACGAAIKAGQALTLEEINNLVDLLFQCENPYTCPHGRPIVIRIPLEEIHRRFMR
jgi:DNA mismatch repair protein MutL